MNMNLLMEKGITIRCRVPMQKQMRHEDGSYTTYTGYCDSTEWKYEHEEVMRRGDSDEIRRMKVKTNIPFCGSGHPLGGTHRIH